MTMNRQHSAIFDDIAQPVVCIMGPTASGKTALACEVFDHANEQGRGVDIISVDSALVYRDMNIGTAKPTEQELKQYPHALVDIIDPTESYSAADFVKDARQLIIQSHASDRLPVLVGGTMLYFQALFGGLNDIPASQPAVREALTARLKAEGVEALHKLLQKNDPLVAERLHSTDSQRIIRALEVYEISGRPLSSYHQASNDDIVLPTSWQVFALMPERSWLHKRIALRLDLMWQSGFLDEVNDLIKKYQLHEDLPAMRSVGYRQVWHYLKQSGMSEADKKEMQDKALFATRQLAKRQYTWLRKLQKKYDMQILIDQEKNHLVECIL